MTKVDTLFSGKWSIGPAQPSVFRAASHDAKDDESVLGIQFPRKSNNFKGDFTCDPWGVSGIFDKCDDDDDSGDKLLSDFGSIELIIDEYMLFLSELSFLVRYILSFWVILPTRTSFSTEIGIAVVPRRFTKNGNPNLLPVKSRFYILN